MDLAALIDAARGQTPADLLLTNARIVNVFTGEIYPGSVAIKGDRIVGVGEYAAARTVDLGGQFLAPGLMDGHVHLESSMVTIPEYARAVVPLGTTAVVIDPHEIANVLGLDGIRYMLAAARGLPLDVHVMLSSCVPATTMETAGARLSADDIADALDEPGVIGLAEMMNFPGVIFKDPEVLAKLAAAAGRPIDGHAPGLSGKDLTAYIAAGIGSDHECTTPAEALEKVRQGMMVLVREGTAAKNLETLLPMVTPQNSGRFMLCTDDRHPGDLLAQGHINYLVQRAVALGLAPALAVRLATLNTATYFRLPRTGAIAPGYAADLIAFADFTKLRPTLVLKRGQVVAENGELAAGQVPGTLAAEPRRQRGRRAPSVRDTIHLRALTAGAFALKAPPAGRQVRVIGVVPNQIITHDVHELPPVVDGHIVADPARDLLKIAVIERHRATGQMGLGLVRGLGLKRGAIASSVAHDSHNLIVAGTNDADMLEAVQELARLQGGLAAVADGKVLGALALPVAGLLAEDPLEVVRDRIAALQVVTRELGCPLADPFMQLSFLALPVIPDLKLTDRGLVDVRRFDFVPLVVEAAGA